MEQWRIDSEEYTETFDNIKVAKRAFGRERKVIREEEEGWVIMYYRDSPKGEWLMHQMFSLGDVELPFKMKK